MKKNEIKGLDGSHCERQNELNMLDCTIRDGGLMNDSNFSDAVVRAVYDCCADCGIEYMEIGFKNSKKLFSKDKYGAWRFCDESDIERIVGDAPRDIKLAAMADAEKSDYKTDILPKSRSPLSLIRVACYSHQIPLALDMVKDAKDKGYEASLNLMAICKQKESELSRDLEILSESEADVIYLMDSFGSLYCDSIRYLMTKYRKALADAGKKIGFHAHNNLQLAFAKTIEAVNCEVDFIDTTMCGLGRGAGNCATELLLGYVGRPILPALKCAQKHIEPMRAKLGWGFANAYMLTGFLNQHPRAAMAYQEAETHGDIAEFYESIIKG
ncbi:MAG: aldolase catalytic domain-containing protein [Opitutales bacterium]|nr:aldolase catalytic domain-containing protein [Opitutales bacterium]